MAEKKFLTNIKMIGSTMVDENGAQISLTKDERESISNASSGPASQSNPVTTKQYVDDLLDAYKAGVRWLNPVDTVTSSAPATPTVGMRYINTTDGKLYECEVEGTWNAGAVPGANWTVFAKDTDEEWTYDLESTSWVMKSSGSIPYATEEMPGKVQFATDGEVSGTKALKSNDSRLIKGRYQTVLADVTGTVTVSHNLGSSKILVQTWSGNDLVDTQIAKNGADASNKVDITVSGTVTSLEVVVIAVP